jgi:hypothetical protein
MASFFIVKQSEPPAKQVEEKRLLPLNKKPLMLKFAGLSKNPFPLWLW